MSSWLPLVRGYTGFVGSMWIALVFDGVATKEIAMNVKEQQEPTNTEKIHRSYMNFGFFNLDAGMVLKYKVYTGGIDLALALHIAVLFGAAAAVDYYSDKVRLLHTEDPAKTTVAKKANILRTLNFCHKFGNSFGLAVRSFSSGAWPCDEISCAGSDNPNAKTNLRTSLGLTTDR
jgi:hypothetical protein